MSRTEELKKKLRSKQFDEGFSEFNSSVEEFLNSSRSASAGSTPFMQLLYEELKEDSPENIREWISKRLEKSFLHEDSAPVWPNEPDWCFLDNHPMIFLSQFTDQEGVEFFVFKGLAKTELGDRAVYKMLAQDREGKIRLEGEIRG